jgi:hypothetical protein
VWILDSGGAKLVDDPSLDPGASASPEVRRSCAALLLDVVRSAQGSAAQPWPMGAHQFIERLQADPPPSPLVMAEELEALAGQPAVVTRRWRVRHLAALVALPLLVAGYGLFGHVVALHWPTAPHFNAIAFLLWNLQSAAEDDRSVPRQTRQGIGVMSARQQTLEAIEVTLASRYRHVLTDPRLLTEDYMFLGLRYREQIDRVLRRKPSGAEIQRASENADLQSMLSFSSKLKSGGKPLEEVTLSIGLFVGDFVGGLIVVAIVALLGAVTWRGGLIRLLGLEIVTADGSRASRLRMFARTALAWAPMLAVATVPALGWYGVAPPFTMTMEILVALLVQFAGAVVAVLYPHRGIQDRLAGTWLAPR